MKSSKRPPSLSAIKRSFGRQKPGSDERKLVSLSPYQAKYPLVQRMHPPEHISLAWRIFFVSVMIGGLLGVAVLVTGCGYSARLTRGGTQLFAAACGTALDDQQCAADVERVRQLTQHHFEAHTGHHVPEEAWAHLAEINLSLLPLYCPGNDANGTYQADKTCGGLLVPEGNDMWTIHVQMASCFAYTRLPHEFIHFMLRYTEGSADPEHEDRTLFYARNSVEERTQAAIDAEGMCEERP